MTRAHLLQPVQDAVEAFSQGTLSASALSTTARAFLFRTDVHDPRVFTSAAGVLAAAALIASLIPARRAAHVDPTVALRVE